jgi:hypothetical protein
MNQKKKKGKRSACGPNGPLSQNMAAHQNPTHGTILSYRRKKIEGERLRLPLVARHRGATTTPWLPSPAIVDDHRRALND